MSIYGTVQSFDQDKWIELFVLDATTLGETEPFYFHAGLNELKANIIWQGNEYIAMPITAEGFAYDSESFPRPKLKLANKQGLFSTLVKTYNDLLGCAVTRKRTAVRYLDAVNFASGNPNANPNEYLEDEIFYITQKTAENKLFIEFELGTATDVKGVYIPRRIVNANYCPFKYRGNEGCPYAGTSYWDAGNNPVSTLAEDVCAKTVTACKLRFGENGELYFGGFKGSNLVQLN